MVIFDSFLYVCPLNMVIFYSHVNVYRMVNPMNKSNEDHHFPMVFLWVFPMKNGVYIYIYICIYICMYIYIYISREIDSTDSHGASAAARMTDSNFLVRGAAFYNLSLGIAACQGHSGEAECQSPNKRYQRVL